MSKYTRPDLKGSLFLAGAFAVGGLILAGTLPTAVALEKQTAVQGRNACYKWCEENNKAGPNRNKCYRNCEKYWYCNGSDARSDAEIIALCKKVSGGLQLQTNPQSPFGPANNNPTGTATPRP